MFKNAELALEAAAILERAGIANFELWLTFNGTENSYAAGLVRRYTGLKSVRFLGLLPRSAVFDGYSRAECLVFPSCLETWGLPITEFKSFRKPILAADLPYAWETLDLTTKLRSSIPTMRELARLMQSVIEGRAEFASVSAAPVAPPFCPNWAGLFEYPVTWLKSPGSTAC